MVRPFDIDSDIPPTQPMIILDAGDEASGTGAARGPEGPGADAFSRPADTFAGQDEHTDIVDLAIGVLIYRLELSSQQAARALSDWSCVTGTDVVVLAALILSAVT